MEPALTCLQAPHTLPLSLYLSLILRIATALSIVLLTPINHFLFTPCAICALKQNLINYYTYPRNSRNESLSFSPRRSTTVLGRGISLLLASQWNCFCEISCSLFSTNCSCSGGPQCVCCLSERWKGSWGGAGAGGASLEGLLTCGCCVRLEWKHLANQSTPMDSHVPPPNPLLVQISRLSIFNANIQIHHRTGWRENKEMERF